MNPGPAEPGEIAEAARVLSALGLVTAFGHVSARSGDVMLITPAADLARVTGADIVPVPLDLPDAGPLAPGAPAEAWAHLALYRARPDAGAVARGQPASAFAAAAATSAGATSAGQGCAGQGSAAVTSAAVTRAAVTSAAVISAAASGAAVTSAARAGAPAGSAGRPGPAARLLPLYGQAAWLGEWVPVHGSAHLLRSADLARRAAADLPAGEALLLRGNGALTLGATPALAVTRMWLLAAACATWLAAAGAGPVTPLTAAEIESWRSVAHELMPRLWQHLRDQALGRAVLDPSVQGHPEPGPSPAGDPLPQNGGRLRRPDIGERSQT